MNQTIGHAPVVRRRTATFPSRLASYFDLTQWGGGYMRVTGVPGAAVIKGDILVDLRSGEVYRDARFAEVAA